MLFSDNTFKISVNLKFSKIIPVKCLSLKYLDMHREFFNAKLITAECRYSWCSN